MYVDPISIAHADIGPDCLLSLSSWLSLFTVQEWVCSCASGTDTEGFGSLRTPGMSMWPTDKIERKCLFQALQRNSQWIRRLPDARKIEEGPRGKQIPSLSGCADDFQRRLNNIPRPILESPRGSQSTDIIRARSRSRSRHKDLGVEVAHKDRLLSPPPQVKIIMRQFPHLSDRQADACLQTIKEETHACIQTFMDKMRKILGTEDTAKVFNALSVVNSDLSFNMLCAYRSTQECDYRSTQTKC